MGNIEKDFDRLSQNGSRPKTVEPATGEEKPIPNLPIHGDYYFQEGSDQFRPEILDKQRRIDQRKY